MRLIILTLLLTVTCVTCVFTKNNPKLLTESVGQEVIEIGTPLKELPPELEEEPSAEADEDATTVTVAPATKKEAKKTTTDGKKKGKDIDVGDGSTPDEETKIEKELAEVYKDTNDYTEITETPTTGKGNVTEKEPLRNRGRETFKFQPDLNNPKEVERFRTSVDDISCDKHVTRKLDNTIPDSAVSFSANILLLTLCISSFFVYEY